VDRKEERLKLLSVVDIFEPLSREEIERLDGQISDLRVEPGAIFYGPDDYSERLFLLLQGKVRIFRMAPGGREFTLAVVGTGTMFGEMALTAQRLEGAYAQAIEPSAVSTMLREDLERLILEKPEVGLRIMQLLGERLRRYEARLEDITLKDVRSRLASIILLLIESEGTRTGTGYRIPAHYTHQQLGTMIGANREAVTRAFGLLQDEGVMERRRRLIYVEDMEELRQVAEYGDTHDAALLAP
jgi:CRP/FNR family cyclic AMP-dependent transcriptional regulator